MSDASLAVAVLERREARLPAPPNRLVDREASVEQIERLLVGGARLVTLTGPGGGGKTRVALAVAARLAEGFDGRVAFVPLAGLADPELLAPTIAQALGLREVAGKSPLDTVKSAVSTTRFLLVLDNFEHLVPAARAVAELLAACPALSVLATSRALLRISAEREYEVPPLPQDAAVELFSDRAPGFALTEENAADVAAMCNRLDGLPLALELAAARASVLSPRAILERLESGLALLTRGARDLPARQQTIRSTIDWSYRLLDLAEQALFSRLGVFAGAFTLEAAAAVCAPTELALDPVDAVGSLVEKNLLRRNATRDRFSMLETIREFALERLVESGEADLLRRRHAEYFLALVERSEAEVATGAGQAPWNERLEAEHDECRAALDWLAVAGDDDLELRLATALARFWRFHNHLSEGSRRLGRALSRAASPPPELRVKALSAAAGFAYFQGRHAEARRGVEAALEVSRELADPTLEGRLLVELALILAAEDELERAGVLLEEAIALFRRVGSDPLLAAATHNLGYLVLRCGDVERASTLFQASLELFRQLADDQGTAVSLHGLGVTSLFGGDPTGALSRFRESLVLAERRRFTIGVVAALEGVAAGLAAIRDARPAALLLGAADEARAVEQAAPEQVERDVRERLEAAVVAELGEGAVELYRAQGRGLGLDDAVALALDESEAPGGRVTRTFLFTDIVGSTRLVEALGDEAWTELLGWHDRTLRSLFAEHGGEEVDHPGDGFFVAFVDPASALECAAAIQRTLLEHRRAVGFAPGVRIGAHTAAAIGSGGSYRGSGVHQAARLAALAGEGEILASVGTLELAPRFRAGTPRSVTVRGSTQPLEVAPVVWSGR